jgi:ankyrin repeat protein
VEENVKQHQALLTSITAVHATYSSNLAGNREANVEAVMETLMPAMLAYHKLNEALTLATQQLRSSELNAFKPLTEQVAQFVEGRRSERAELTNRLMVDELLSAVRSGSVEAVEAVLADETQKIDVGEIGPDGKTAVQLAVQMDNVPILRLLASKGADVRVRDADDHTMLWLAVEEKRVECATSLIEFGADPDRAEDESTGETILHILTKADRLEMVQMLLDNKANPNVKSKDGRTALLHACSSGATDVLETLTWTDHCTC